MTEKQKSNKFGIILSGKGKRGIESMYRQILLSAITKNGEQESKLARSNFPGKLSVFLLPFSRVLLGVAFVFISLPSFLTKTQRQDFQRTARVDEDGAILDSYVNFTAYYRAGIAILIIVLSMLSFLMLDAVSFS